MSTCTAQPLSPTAALADAEHLFALGFTIPAAMLGRLAVERVVIDLYERRAIDPPTVKPGYIHPPFPIRALFLTRAGAITPGDRHRLERLYRCGSFAVHGSDIGEHRTGRYLERVRAMLEGRPLQ